MVSQTKIPCLIEGQHLLRTFSDQYFEEAQLSWFQGWKGKKLREKTHISKGREWNSFVSAILSPLFTRYASHSDFIPCPKLDTSPFLVAEPIHFSIHSPSRPLLNRGIDIHICRGTGLREWQKFQDFRSEIGGEPGERLAYWMHEREEEEREKAFFLRPVIFIAYES